MRFGFVAVVAGIAMLTMNSCQKDARQWASEQSVTPFKSRPANLSDDQVRMTEQLIGQIPTVRLYDESNGRYMDINIQKRTIEREWTFADPSIVWQIDSSGVGTWEEQAAAGFVVLNIGIATGSGGTVVAGSSALTMDYTFCFTAEMDAVGLDLFGFGGNFDGVSSVVGISGDFEALANDELGEEPEFEDFFHGFAMYIVYDNAAQGTYDVLNWFEDLESEFDDLEDNSFSFVIDFVNPSIYFSSDGSLTVSGGSMNFNGEYLAITDFVFEFEDDFEPEFSYVFGYGEMGCN